MMGTGEMEFSQLLRQDSQFVQQQRPDLAIPLLEQAVAFEPNSFEARFWLGALVFLPLVFFCPPMCVVQIAVDIFLRAAAIFSFIVAVCEYVLGMHLESTYHPSWQISLATSIIWFLLSLVGIGLIVGAPLVMR